MATAQSTTIHEHVDFLLANDNKPFSPSFCLMSSNSIDNNNNNGLLRKGQFYFIYDRRPDLVLEDKTKRGLEVRERVLDDKYGVEADRGMIHDMDGIGHKVGIRWYFPQAKYSLDHVVKIAQDIDARYKAIREMTCPDDD